MSLYDDLGLSPAASAEEIKSAHRSGVKSHHPDSGGDREDFDRLQRAYEVLSDPASRRRYDETGAFSTSTAPSEEQEVMTLVQQVLAELIASKDDLSRVDLIGAALAAISKRLAAVAQRTTEADLAMERIGEARRRISRIGQPTGDPLAGLFEHQVREWVSLKARVQHAVQIHAAAIELLHTYSYQVDTDAGLALFSHSPGEIHVTVGDIVPNGGAARLQRK